MRKILFLIVLILHESFNLFSQGKIIGITLEEVNVPASFATIALMSAKDSSIVKGLMSDEYGKFSFDNIELGEYMLGITYVGFEKTYTSKLVLSSVNNTIDIGNLLLKKGSQILQEVVVTTQKKVMERLPDRFIMNVSSSTFSSSSLLDLFRATPFMNVQGNSISLKGKPNLLVLLDNRPIPQESLGNLLESMTGGEIEKIEFITIPSSKYDASVDGVINIITKKGMKVGLNGSVRGAFSQGILSNINTGLNLTYRQEKYSIFAKYGFIGGEQISIQNGFRKFSINNSTIVYNTYQERIFKNQFHSPQIGIDFYLHKNHTLGLLLDANIINPPAGRWASYTDFSSKIGGKDSTLTAFTDNIYKSNSINYSLNYKGILDSAGKELSVIISYLPIDGNLSNNLSEQVITNYNNQVLSRIAPIQTNNPSNYNIWVGQVDFTLPFKNEWRVETGVKVMSSISEFKTIQLKLISDAWKAVPELSFSNNLSEKISSIYANIAKNHKKTYYQVGLRIENTLATAQNVYNYDYTNLFPSFLIQQKFSTDYQLSINYRKKIIRPSYSQVLPYAFTLDLYTIGEGNIALKPQYSDVLTLTNSIKNNTYITFEYTKNEGEVLELPTQKGNVTIWKPTNINSSYNFTSSVYQTLNIKSWWQINNYLWGAYYIASGDVNSNNTKISGFGWVFGTSSTFTLPREWKVDLYYSYDSPYFSGLSTAIARNFGRLAFRKSAFKKSAEFTLSIDDVFKGTYYGGDMQIGNLVSHYNNYQDTRRMSLGFTYRFGKKTVTQIQEKSLGNEDAKQRAGSKI